MNVSSIQQLEQSMRPQKVKKIIGTPRSMNVGSCVFKDDIPRHNQYFFFNSNCFLVFVHGTPGKPGGVSASNLDAQSGKVVWTDGTIYGDDPYAYRIDGKTNHNQTWITLVDKVNIN